jgi:pimeloyl-ACP methyl ester carboxylesterase
VPRRPAERMDVPVRAGTLAAHRWPADSPGAPLVVAVHGITANGLSWARVADHLDGAVTLVAPDLRGRGASRDVPPGEGIDGHAKDVVSVLDAGGVDSAVVAGHSMGAFVATRTARMYERRVRSVVLVDGGVGFPPPQGVGTDALLEATIGPAMRRLRMTFPSRQAYREYWQAHPALAGAWAPWIDETIQHDLVGTEPELRSSCQLDAIRSDGERMLNDPEVREAIRLMRVPAVLLWARRGLLNEEQGLYDEQRLAHANLDPERIRTIEVPDTNHYLIVYADRCAALVARHIRAAAGV